MSKTATQKYVEAQINGTARTPNGHQYPKQVFFNLIACRKVEMRQMPGGEFLWVRMAPNTAGYTKDNADKRPDLEPIRSIHDEFTLDAETAPHALMLIGIETKRGAMVFEYENCLYTRAHRHHVQGRGLKSYTKYYRTHPQAWRSGKPGGYMCLKPFTGEWLKLKARPKGEVAK